MMKPPSLKDEKYMLTRLRSARKNAGLSQTRAAALLEKTQSYISKLESGRSRVHVATLMALARIYQTRFEYFVKGGDI